MTTAKEVHKQAIIIDATAPLLQQRRYVDLYIEGGVTCVAPTVGGKEFSGPTLKHIGQWLRFIKNRPDLILVRTAADIERAKEEGKLGILFHFQGSLPFELDLDLVDAYHALGLRMAMLCYNVRDFVGDGCEEDADAGLSRFGRRLIERLNDNRIVVDVTHTGYRTTMEAMEVSRHPVVFSHSNPRALLDTRRNILDEQARAAAQTGGLVGLTLVPYFIVRGRRPTLDDFVNAIEHFAEVAGIDHVGIGLDYWWGQQPFSSDEEADANWRKFVDAGIWDPENYPRPPHHYPEGLYTPAEMSGLVAALLRRGFSAEDTKKVLGRNWLRVFKAVWGS